MELKDFLDLFDDTLYIVRDGNGDIIYPTDDERRAYLEQLNPRPNDVFYSAVDDKYYYLDAKKAAGSDYLVYRFSDVTKDYHFLNSYEVDACTGLFIRRKFLEVFNDYLLKLKENPEDFSVVMADIDFFKKVNDNYGHLAGDKVLKDVAQTIFTNIRSKAVYYKDGKALTRPVDILGRYGGEEFLFVMKNITSENADNRVNQIRQKIEELNPEFVYPNDGKEVHIPVTASFGVAHISKELIESLDITPENVSEMTGLIIEEADEMLYKSKRNGRNMVSLREVYDMSLNNANERQITR